MAPGSGLLRLTRVAVFALTAVGLAGTAHVAAGGTGSPWVALLAVPVVMLVINLLAARRRSIWGLLSAMALTELALHVAFMTASGSASCQVTSAGEAGHAPGHAAASAEAWVQCDPMTSHAASHMVMGGAGPAPGMMLAAHAVAIVVTVLVLARGEAAVWALASCRAFRVLTIPMTRRHPLHPRLVVLGAQTLDLPRLPVQRCSVRRRGPPLRVGTAQ